MTFHLVLIAVPLALLGIFLAVVSYEGRRGRRLMFSGPRYRLDQRVERATFLVRHVDWGAFLNDLTRSGAERFLHDAAHATLIGVRAVERELTGVVRTLRARREPAALPPPDAQAPSRLTTATTYLQKTVRRARKLPVQEQTDEQTG